MVKTYSTLSALFTDIADAIREKTGEAASIVADDFPDVIRERLKVKQFKPAGKSYLTFSSPNSFTLAVNDATKHWDGTIEYFASNKTWTVWDGITVLSSDTSGLNNVLYLRGIGNTKITGNSSSYKWDLTGSDISCIGNIENILDYATVESGAHPTMADYCYSNMFNGCTALTQAPALPATTLADSCYYYMFRGCTSLTQAPALPATTLTSYCYNSMFNGCTSLTQTPDLPATTLADYCYQYMFSGCTALIQATALPATILDFYCYGYMFSNCPSLTKSPDLPATTLANYCYHRMFLNCISLTQAPALPATTLASNCYSYMFSGCTSLTQAPALPATTLANKCYYDMFKGCTGLTQAPALPATTLADYCYNSMFDGCTSLKLSSTKTGEYTQEYIIPIIGTGKTATNALLNMFYSTGGTFTGTPSINTIYYLSNINTVVYPHYLTFRSPSSFTLKVNDTTKHWDGTLEYSTDTSTWSIWDGTTTLSSATIGSDNGLYLRGIGNTIITGNSSNYKWVLTGSNIKCVGNIENLLDYETVESGNHPTMKDFCYAYMFRDCTALIQAPDLPATTLAEECYSGMFFGCTALTQAPALPATRLKGGCYQFMFNKCTSLTQAPALPATTLATYCYFYMFYDCTALTQAPALPATTLNYSCYSNMFNGCTALTQVPALPATTLASYCYSGMFEGCTSIKLSSTKTGEYTVAYRIPIEGTGTAFTSPVSNMFLSTGGTFTGTPEINTTYYLSNTNTVVR